MLNPQLARRQVTPGGGAMRGGGGAARCRISASRAAYHRVGPGRRPHPIRAWARSIALLVTSAAASAASPARLHKLTPTFTITRRSAKHSRQITILRRRLHAVALQSRRAGPSAHAGCADRQEPPAGIQSAVTTRLEAAGPVAIGLGVLHRTARTVLRDFWSPPPDLRQGRVGPRGPRNA
jgi:hypothetical protein